MNEYEVEDGVAKVAPKEKQRKRIRELHNFIGFAIGISVNIIIATIAYLVLPNWYGLGGIIITVGYFGLGGIINIPIGFKGVPLMFGRRISFFVLPEGLNWVLPRPFMNSENVNMKELTSDPGLTTVLTGKGKETVRVIVDAAIQWKIYNAFQVLSVGISVIEKGMDNLIKEVVRSTIADKSPDEAIQIHEKLKDDLETKATEKSDDWGIEITNVFITQLGFSDDVIKDFEKVTREDKQRTAERTELQHVREQIESFKSVGLKPESAKEIVQTERDKVTKTIEEKIYKGLGGTGILGPIVDKFLSDSPKNQGEKRPKEKRRE